MVKNRFEAPRRRSFQGERLFRGIGSLCMVGAAAVGGGAAAEANSSPDNGINAISATNAQPGLVEQLAPTNKNVHDTLDDLQVVIIDNPKLDSRGDTTPEEARNVLRVAGDAMSETTNGVLSIPQFVPVHMIDQRPTGTFIHENKTVSCLSDDDIDNARKKAFLRDGVPLSMRTAAILNDYPGCRDNEALSWAWSADSNNGVDLTVYSDDFVPYYVVHEEGHIEGLKHSSMMTCPWRPGDKNDAENMTRRSETDIRELVSSKACVVPLNPKGGINEYADVHTMMGSRGSIVPEQEIYNFTEINQISPESAMIKVVQPETQKHVLGVENEDLRGLRIPLPWTHPLRSIDPSLQFLNIGAEPIDDDEIQVRIIATGNGISYDLSYIYQYMPSLDAETGEKQTLYTDSTLGIKISAEGVKVDGHYLKDKAFVNIEVIPQ